jgi:hypothetical protein
MAKMNPSCGISIAARETSISGVSHGVDRVSTFGSLQQERQRTSLRRHQKKVCLTPLCIRD